MLLAAGTEFVEVVIVLSSIVPVIGIAWFAWWFLRAGKRYDEREGGSAGGEAARPATERPFMPQAGCSG